MNIDKIRNEFPALKQKINGNPLIYFDNGATSLKPNVVINSINEYYSSINSNVHRAGHYLSAQATIAYENARSNIARFINASDVNEVIFTKGTTESINLIVEILKNGVLKDGDEVILTKMEHHSNIVPWVSLKEKINIKIKTIDIDENGVLILDNIEALFNENTKVISFAHSSNVLGSINPIKKLVEIAKKYNVITVVDGAQGIVHDKVDVLDIDCDFYCFSGHKMYAPMGIGVLYGKSEILNELSPYQKGGGMIENVSFEQTTYNVLPYKFEAGTPNVGGAIGLSTAINYIESIGLEKIIAFEQELLAYATIKMKQIKGLTIMGNSINKDPIVSFAIEGIHHYDMGAILDQYGIAMRTGHHCAQPLMKELGINGTARISFAFYNTKEEIDYFIEKLKIAIKMLK